MTLSEQEAVIVGCIIGSFIVIIFGLLLWYFCADTTREIDPDYSKLRISTKKPDDTCPVVQHANSAMLGTETQSILSQDNNESAVTIDRDDGGDGGGAKSHCSISNSSHKVAMEEEKTRTDDDTNSNPLRYLIVSVFQPESHDDTFDPTVIEWFWRLDMSVSFDKQCVYSIRINDNVLSNVFNGECIRRRFKFEQKPQNIDIRFNIRTFFGCDLTEFTFHFDFKESVPNNYCFRVPGKNNYVTLFHQPELRIGIDYQPITPSKLQMKLKKCEQVFWNWSDEEDLAYFRLLAEWFDSNKAVIFSLKQQVEHGVPLANGSFAQMI
eukprot:284078_1